MAMRKLATALALGALAFVAGCRSTSNRVAFSQPVVVAPAPVVQAVPGPAPCCNGAPAAGPVVPGQPPLGAQVPLPQPPCNGRY